MPRARAPLRGSAANRHGPRDRRRPPTRIAGPSSCAPARVRAPPRWTWSVSYQLPYDPRRPSDGKGAREKGEGRHPLAVGSDRHQEDLVHAHLVVHDRVDALRQRGCEARAKRPRERRPPPRRIRRSPARAARPTRSRSSYSPCERRSCNNASSSAIRSRSFGRPAARLRRISISRLTNRHSRSKTSLRSE